MQRRNNSRFILIKISIAIVILFGLFFRGFFVSEEEAYRALDTQGFNDVQIYNRDIFFVGFRGCSSGDAVKFDARAKNPAGKDVNVFVCLGWPFKGATIRNN